MKERNLLEKINDIDDDLVEEAAQAGKIRKFPVGKVIAAAACVVVCAVTAVGIGSRMKTGKAAPDEEKAQAYDIGDYDGAGGDDYICDAEAVDESEVMKESAETAAETTPGFDGLADKTRPEISTEKNKEESNEKSHKTDDAGVKVANEETANYNTAENYLIIPAVPKNKVVVTGDKLTESEARAYLIDNRESIVSALASSGVPADDIVISERGICHLSYDGSTMEYLELKQDRRDYLVYNGDKLVAIVTLWKENGKIYSTPIFGAKWFDGYNKFLKAHKGQKLVYVYANNNEIVIAPDGTCYMPLHNDADKYFEGIKDPYLYFHNDAAVYIP